MKPSGPLVSSGASTSSSGRPDADAVDFAWPPTADDLEGCGIVDLAAHDDANPTATVFVRLADILEPVAGPSSTSTAAGAPRGPQRPMDLPRPGRSRSRHWGVERPDVSFPFRADADEPRVETSGGGETWRAIVAVAAGLSLAVLSYAQFRGLRGDATALVAAVANATTPPTSREPEITIEIPAVVSDAVRRVSAAHASPVSEASADSSVEAAPIGKVLTRLAADVIDEMRPAPDPVVSAVAPAETRMAAAVPHEEPRPLPAVLRDERPAEAPPVAMAAVHVDPAPGDEDHIRAALSRWRTAYSELDARAAREVWPSVDAPALERAFQALKSQDLRFDRCDLTVNGGSAQAACSGRAVYVPRVGNQSPKAAPREWTFELKKLDERWTIASARAS
jgi:hypothetical protein